MHRRWIGARVHEKGSIRHIAPHASSSKPGSTTLRLVVHYGELNKRTQNHSDGLPIMEHTLECISSCRYKMKMDKRNGFWQVDLTIATEEQPVVKWLVMPLGVANAPVVLQELMNKVLHKLRRRPMAQALIERGTQMEAHIDSVCLGTNTKEGHYILLQAFFSVCQEHNLRIKLEKCEFVKEEMEYLGFDVGCGWSMPAASKTLPLMHAKIIKDNPKQGVKSVRSFIRASNFCRRHIQNFTYTSARLTDLTKKRAPWAWGPEEEKCFREVKDKIANAKWLGVPRPHREIILANDAYDKGGWGSPYQWQLLHQEEHSAVMGKHHT